MNQQLSKIDYTLQKKIHFVRFGRIKDKNGLTPLGFIPVFLRRQILFI